MKIRLIRSRREGIATGSVFMLSMVFALWLQADSDLNKYALPTDLMALNQQYSVFDAETLDKEKIDPYGATEFRANMTKVVTVDPHKPTQELILKLDSGQDNLEGIVIMEMQTDIDMEEVAKKYEKARGVLYAEPNYSIELSSLGDENSTAGISADMVDQIVNDNSKNEVLVAVIDSGVDIDHKDLKERMTRGWDVINNTDQIVDYEGHGTHVAGIILKNSRTAKILPIKFTEGSKGVLDDLLRAIKYAADQKAQIMNLSLGVDRDFQSMEEAIDYALDRDIIVVAAAGNGGKEQKYYPAAWPEIISVAALTTDGGRLDMSNYGEWVKFSAIGENVYSTVPGDGYAYASGTSQATPVVTALVADMIGMAAGDFDKNDIQEYLDNISEPTDRDRVGRKIVLDDVLRERILVWNAGQMNQSTAEDLIGQPEAEMEQEETGNRSNRNIRFKQVANN